METKQPLNGFAQWEIHCAEAGHVTVADAYDAGLIKSLHGPAARKYAGYVGNPSSNVACTAPGCTWRSMGRK